MHIKEIQKKVCKVSNRYSKECNINRDDDWYILKLQEELGELIQSYLSLTQRGRNRGKTKTRITQDFGDELADVIGQVLLLADKHNIDIEEALERKWFKYLKAKDANNEVGQTGDINN